MRQMVALTQRDRKLPNSALMQPTAEYADCCGNCQRALVAHYVSTVDCGESE